MVTNECIGRLVSRWRHDFDMPRFGQDDAAIPTMVADCEGCCETDMQVEGAYASFRAGQAGSRYRPKWINFLALLQEHAKRREEQRIAEAQAREREQWRAYWDTPEGQAKQKYRSGRAEQVLERLCRRLGVKRNGRPRTDRMAAGRDRPEGTDREVAEAGNRTEGNGTGNHPPVRADQCAQDATPGEQAELFGEDVEGVPPGEIPF